MKTLFYGLFILGMGVFFTGLSAQESAVADKSSGVSFPRTVSFDYHDKQYQLDATGVATRKKLIIKVYSVAHYLQNGTLKSGGDKIQAIMSDENAKQLTLKWLRDIDGNKVKEGFLESFHKILPGDSFAKLSGDIERFLQLFNQGVHKGEESVIRWIPGGTIEVVINGTEAGAVTNVAFAKALWSIWFGNNSVVNRNDLLSYIH